VGRDTVSVLKKLNMSLLFEFLDLLKVLTAEPSRWEEKVESLKKSLFEMHHILNSFRPHEARESVIALLQRQVERRKATLAEVEGRIQQADNILAAARDRLLTRTSTLATQHSASTQLLEEAQQQQQQQQQRQHVNPVLPASTAQLAQATQVHNSLLAMNTYLNTLSQQYLKYGDAVPLVNNDADAMDTS
jgi:DNA repair exonuclease SbcCD ATPase subunit